MHIPRVSGLPWRCQIAGETNCHAVLYLTHNFLFPRQRRLVNFHRIALGDLVISVDGWPRNGAGPSCNPVSPQILPLGGDV